jgi:serine/threonine-protein kinase
VTIFVGKEPPDVDVPNVVGQGRLEAQAALEKAGFKVDLVPQDTTDKAQDVHVISQDPASGKAKKGSTVTITYGHYTGASSTAPATTSVPGTTQ